MVYRNHHRPPIDVLIIFGNPLRLLEVKADWIRAAAYFKTRKMTTIKVKFYCNAGYTTETVNVEIEIDKSSKSSIEDQTDAQIQEAFLEWLDRNEDCGWEITE